MPDRLLPDLDGKVRHALIRICVKQLLPLKLANVLVALLLIYSMWEHGNRFLLIGWFALLLFFMTVELFICNAFKRHVSRFKHVIWVVLLSVPTLLVGLVWGAAVPLFMDVSNSLNVITITILLLGMLSGSLYTLSLLPPLFHLFTVGVLLQYAFTLYAEQGFMTIVIASLGLGLFFAWLSHQLFRITYDLLLSRYKNKAYAYELKKAKQIAEQASAAKTRFLASASHDLRQPLQAMALYAETLSYRLRDPNNMKSIEALKKSHNSMSSIMDSLLDISKMDAGIIEPNIGIVNLQPVISHLVNNFRMISQKKGVCIRSRDTNIHVYSDVILLKRILRNLISNAVRYTDAGEILVACRRRGGMVMVEVWDTGKGIARDQFEKVFFEFYQLDNPERDQQKGLGLGLAIVQRLTHLLPDHRIDLCSRLGQGSRFRLSMPVAENIAADEKVENGITEVDQFHALQVLVIEDDEAVREAMVSLMQAWDCRVRGVAGATAAVAQVEQGWVPDAVIADYRLPDGETGVEAIKAIRGLLQQHIPALIVTGESLPETLQDIQMEDVLLLHKPVPAPKLRLFLRRCGRH